MVAGYALYGELLDNLGLVEVADRRGLRPIGPGGYSDGEYYRPNVELQLAGGDFLSDVSLIADDTTRRLRHIHGLPSQTTLYPFLTGADLGRVARAQAIHPTFCAARGRWGSHRRASLARGDAGAVKAMSAKHH